MKAQEKYLNRKVIPLKTELASLANRYQASIANISATQESYILDVKAIHQLCDIVSKLPDDRRRRNEDLIKSDLTGLVSQANPKEEILIAAKEEFEKSVGGVKDTVREMALMIKKIQIDTTELDYNMMVRADSALADIFVKLITASKVVEIKIDEVLDLGFDQAHKEKIEEEYQRRDGGKGYLYISSWRPFNEQIKEFEHSEDTEKIEKLYYSFKNLLDSIEWSFDAQHFEHSYVPVLQNMYRMQDLILAKTQELEYSKIRPDDCAHPLTQEFIKFYQKVYGHMAAIMAEMFYEHPAHKDLMEILNIRIAYFDEMKIMFRDIKTKFRENKKRYFVQEYWDRLSSTVYDFMERIYTSNVHQKLKINELVKRILNDTRHKLEYVVKEMADFHRNLDISIKEVNENYQKLCVEEYNAYYQQLILFFRTIQIEEGYKIEFMPDRGFNIKFNKLYCDPLEPVEYYMDVRINPPQAESAEPWKFSAAAKLVTTDNKELMARIDKEFHFYTPTENYDWITYKTFKIPNYTMEDFMNMYVKKRTVIADGRFFDSYMDYYSFVSKESVVSNENMKPPIEKNQMVEGSGWSGFTTVRRRTILLKLPILPSFVDLYMEYYFVMLNSKHLLQFMRGQARDLPGGETFYLIMCMEIKEVDEPKEIQVVEHYSLAILQPSLIESVIRKYLPGEIITNLKRIEATMTTIATQNKPNVIEKNPNDPLEMTYAYDKKALNTVKFKAIRNRETEIFARPDLLAEQRLIADLKNKRRYLGEYDKRAAYHTGPEALNPDYEDIYNIRQANRGRVDKAVEYLAEVKDKNIGLIEEITEKNRHIIDKYKHHPEMLKHDIKSYLKDWRVQVTIGVIILMVALKIYGY